jgi:hypothetical protein
LFPFWLDGPGSRQAGGPGPRGVISSLQGRDDSPGTGRPGPRGVISSLQRRDDSPGTNQWVAELLELWPSHPLAQSGPNQTPPKKVSNLIFFLVVVRYDPLTINFKETGIYRNHSFIEIIHQDSLNLPNLRSLRPADRNSPRTTRILECGPVSSVATGPHIGGRHAF